MNQLDRIEAMLIELKQDLRTWNTLKEQQLRVALVYCGNRVLSIQRIFPTEHGVVVEVSQ